LRRICYLSNQRDISDEKPEQTLPLMVIET
jgi:hypothetical protein